MRNDKDDYTTTQALFTLKNIGLGIAHHSKITVTTRYKKDDGYPAFDIVMPPNCEKSTYVQFNVAKYEGELGKEGLLRFFDYLINSHISASLRMISSKKPSVVRLSSGSSRNFSLKTILTHASCAA